MKAPKKPNICCWPASAVAVSSFAVLWSAGTVTSVELGTGNVASDFVGTVVDTVTASSFEMVQPEDYNFD